MRLHNRNSGVLGLFLLMVAVGCGKGKDPTYPLKGRVFFSDGNPVPAGSISFRAIDRNPPISARGEIQPDGTFTVSTFDRNDGAVAGRHQVAIVSAGGLAPRLGFVPPPVYPPVDSRFADFEHSGLEVTVSSDPSANNFELQVLPPKVE